MQHQAAGVNGWVIATVGTSKIEPNSLLTMLDPNFDWNSKADRAVATAERVLRVRRKRAQDLPEVNDLFHDPAWDILLDLFVQTRIDKWISVSSACIASGVPGTTALRAINMLERRGVIERVPDVEDARRSLVALTPKFRAKTERLLSAEPNSTNAPNPFASEI